MSRYDLVIRNGTLVDGTGTQPFTADIALRGDRIVAVGDVPEKGHEEIDASGMLVTPGFVDLHTHYDAQATWSQRLQPSSQHGVTTVIMGNCGVGFAPCHKRDHEELVTLMEGVEDIPEAVLHEGLTWDWETFPEFLDRLATSPHDIDVAVYLPHSPLRVYVMGQRALDREPATDHDLAEMNRLLAQAVEAGAMGFATSRTAVHRNGRGELIPSFEADLHELQSLAGTLKRLGRGVIQGVPNVAPEAMLGEIKLFTSLARSSGRPVMVSLVQTHDDPEGWREQLRLIRDANVGEGVPIRAQVFPRATAAILGLTVSLNPFSFCPSYAPLAKLPLEERLRELRRPEIRTALLREEPVNPGSPFFAATRNFAGMFYLSEQPDYEPDASQTITALAQARGLSAEELAYDLLLRDDGRALIYLPLANFAENDLDAVRQMMLSEQTLFGLGDGGAHYGFVCDSGYPTFLLAYWTRDRASGRLPLEWVIKGLTQDPAKVVGLNDRGIVAPGYKADLNVIDYEGLKLNRPQVISDLPGGGRRLVEIPSGYKATIVSGRVTYRDGKPTGKLPGQLVRGPCESAAREPA